MRLIISLNKNIKYHLMFDTYIYFLKITQQISILKRLKKLQKLKSNAYLFTKITTKY